MRCTIKNKDGNIIYSGIHENRRESVEYCVNNGINLDGAVFDRFNLYHSKLKGAKLTNCSFFKADLYKADLTGADLTGADLTGVKDLSFCKGNGKEIKHKTLMTSVDGFAEHMTWTDGHLAIGTLHRHRKKWPFEKGFSKINIESTEDEEKKRIKLLFNENRCAICKIINL